MGDYREAGRCYLEASRHLEGVEKKDCLLVCWRRYMEGIVRTEYECSFAWHGDRDEHESDHDLYSRILGEYQREAERVLEMLLRTEDIPRSEVVAQAEAECARLEQVGGWGAARCRAILAGARARIAD